MKCGGFCACFFVQQVARYGSVYYYFCMRRLLAFLRGALYANTKLNTIGDDMLNETKPQTPFQEKISSLFQQSLTEEQRFLQGILRGEIQTFSHEEVVATLRETLKR